MSNYYLPRCCFVRADGGGGWEVGHTETSAACRHAPSGGTGGYADGQTPCNRIIGGGQTRADAIQEARYNLDLE